MQKVQFNITRDIQNYNAKCGTRSELFALVILDYENSISFRIFVRRKGSETLNQFYKGKISGKNVKGIFLSNALILTGTKNTKRVHSFS